VGLRRRGLLCSLSPSCNAYHRGIRLTSEVVLTRAVGGQRTDIGSHRVNASIEADSTQLSGCCWTTDIE
jgi:hypothetical protein